MATKTWFVYLLRCSDNSLYTGITTELDRRIKEHNQDNIKGAKYTRVRRPVSLAYTELAETRSQANKREHQIKKLNKQSKERLVKSFLNKKEEQA